MYVEICMKYSTLQVPDMVGAYTYQVTWWVHTIGGYLLLRHPVLTGIYAI